MEEKRKKLKELLSMRGAKDTAKNYWTVYSRMRKESTDPKSNTNKLVQVLMKNWPQRFGSHKEAYSSVVGNIQKGNFKAARNLKEAVKK